jgi:predicted nucleic acid-binding protein
MRKARRRIEQAPRVAERDLEDAVYLACAVDGGAHLITTEDSDLRSLGDEYEGVRILSWSEFYDYIRQRGLLG